MLQVKLLGQGQEVLEVKITKDFNLEALRKAIAEISEKDILKRGRILDIDLRIEEFTALDMIRVPEITPENLRLTETPGILDRYQAITELQQIILGVFLQVNLASAYLTHEYCHLYGKVAIGINGTRFSIVTQHGA